MAETAINYLTGDSCAWFSTDENKWVTWAKRMAQKYPDEVRIQSEDKDGTIVAAVPIKWFKLTPPRKVNLTDERRKDLAERMKKAREAKVNKGE